MQPFSLISPCHRLDSSKQRVRHNFLFTSSLFNVFFHLCFISLAQSHVSPSIPFLNSKINIFLPSTALFGGSQRAACITGAPAGSRMESNAYNAPIPSLKETISACKSTVWQRRMEGFTPAWCSTKTILLKMWSYLESSEVRNNLYTASQSQKF